MIKSLRRSFNELALQQMLMEIDASLVGGQPTARTRELVDSFNQRSLLVDGHAAASSATGRARLASAAEDLDLEALAQLIRDKGIRLPYLERHLRGQSTGAHVTAEGGLAARLLAALRGEILPETGREGGSVRLCIAL